MAIKKSSVKKEDKSEKAIAQKDKPISLATNSVKSKFAKVKTVKSIGSVLPTLFYIIWILIGLFLLWFIYANYRLGAFDSLMQKSSSPSAQSQAAQQAPTETTIPGIGKVNINCVQTSLNQDAIMKIVQEKSDKSLSSEEKKKLQACIVGTPDTSVEATPTPNK